MSRMCRGILRDDHETISSQCNIIRWPDLLLQAAVQGLSPKIPTDKLVLVLSEDGVEWTETNTAIETGVRTVKI